MPDNRVSLSCSGALRHYARSKSCDRVPQLLSLTCRRRDYRFVLLHAEEEQYNDKVRKELSFAGGVHAHNIYHLVLYTQGNGRAVLNGRRVPVRRGTFILTSPGEPHDLGLSGNGDFRSMEFTFGWREEKRKAPLVLPFHQVLALYLGAETRPVVFPVALDEPQLQRLEYLGDTLLDRLTRQPPAPAYHLEYRLAGIFLFLADELYRPIKAAQEQPDSGRDPLFLAREEIRRCYNEKISWARLARKACLSTGYLGQAFKKQFGAAPHVYQQSLRINAAKVLLSSTRQRMMDIAEHLGYADVYAFSKMFKKMTGFAPRAFRAAHPAVYHETYPGAP